MFVRSILSADPTTAEPQFKRLTPRDLVPTRATTLAGVDGYLVNRSGDFDLSGREAWIFISIKNRAFNRPYVNWFIDLCEENDMIGHICRVDDPYRFNRMAEMGCDELPEEEVLKIERLSSDIGRMAQKAINGKRTDRVDIVMWRDIADDMPVAYYDEIKAAFDNQTLVREVLRQHVCSVKEIDCEEIFERYAQFFLCEVPILLHAYYRETPVLDIYPGPQPDFFWQIEMGLFANELPLLTELVKRGRSMLYLETTDRPGAEK